MHVLQRVRELGYVRTVNQTTKQRTFPLGMHANNQNIRKREEGLMKCDVMSCVLYGKEHTNQYVFLQSGQINGRKSAKRRTRKMITMSKGGRRKPNQPIPCFLQSLVLHCLPTSSYHHHHLYYHRRDHHLSNCHQSPTNLHLAFDWLQSSLVTYRQQHAHTQTQHNNLSSSLDQHMTYHIPCPPLTTHRPPATVCHMPSVPCTHCRTRGSSCRSMLTSRMLPRQPRVASKHRKQQTKLLRNGLRRKPRTSLHSSRRYVTRFRLSMQSHQQY